ncbi:hypothetical protein PLEOSDRAFT_164954 [Pleurotus ostreatus PC15]|uniref:DUF6533 domain-containing protein n=1 Tax=Pleurotus ostreatus (strain PC15) TaxID=1137138 RepID=A0A067P8B5_PLEO1|nr:hypothetical protein PLEOSDRAFT_164954 [Pleurotus ostreatus PC15]
MPPGGTLFLESSSLTVREYTYLASLTVLVYEYFTTLYLEVDFIWNISQALFFSLDRTGQDPYTYRQCIAWHSFQTASFQTLLFVVECIQTMKIQALYAGNRKMLWTLHSFRAVALCLMTYTTVATLILLSYDGACIVSSVPWHVVWFGWVIPYGNKRSQTSINVVRNHHSGFLLHLLVGDNPIRYHYNPRIPVGSHHSLVVYNDVINQRLSHDYQHVGNRSSQWTDITNGLSAPNVAVERSRLNVFRFKDYFSSRD